MLRVARTLLQVYSSLAYSRSLLVSAAQKYAYGLKHIWYFQWYISIKNQRTPLNRIANGCSRVSHVSAIQKKKERTLENSKELSIQTPPVPVLNPVQKMKGWNLSKKMLFPPCVVVDFFFDEKERRYATTRRQRKEHKKRRNSPAQVKTPRTRTPFVRSFPALFIHSSAMREERYKNRFVSIKQKESKRWRKELPPFHPQFRSSLSLHFSITRAACLFTCDSILVRVVLRLRIANGVGASA